MAKNILHMVTPLAHISPFDVNMALDAGYDATAAYANVSVKEITALVQDAMFSRSPRDAARTGVFIGGKDAFLALDMLEAAEKALLKPFEISLFADPAGSFTTAAAMIAIVEKTLTREKGPQPSWRGRFRIRSDRRRRNRVRRHRCAGKTRLSRWSDMMGVSAWRVTPPKSSAGLASMWPLPTARRPRKRRRSWLRPRSCSAPREPACACLTPPRLRAPRDCWSPPTSTPCRRSELKASSFTRTARRLASFGAVGIGALAIGNVKYRTESGLFRQMTESKTALRLDFRQAFELARTLA